MVSLVILYCHIILCAFNSNACERHCASVPRNRHPTPFGAQDCSHAHGAVAYSHRGRGDEYRTRGRKCRSFLCCAKLMSTQMNSIKKRFELQAFFWFSSHPASPTRTERATPNVLTCLNGRIACIVNKCRDIGQHVDVKSSKKTAQDKERGECENTTFSASGSRGRPQPSFSASAVRRRGGGRGAVHHCNCSPPECVITHGIRD